MSSSSTVFDVSLAPVSGVDLGPIAQVVAGPAGVLVEGQRGVAHKATGAFAVHALGTVHQRWVARADDFLWVGGEKSIALGEGGPRITKGGADKLADLSAPTQSAWDHARGVLVRFGGVAPGNKFSNATREWKDGAWRECKPKNKPTARNLGALCWVPPMGGVVMFGGWNNKDGHLSDTASFDGKEWTSWPSALPEGALPTAPAALWYDEASSQLLHLREAKGRVVGVWRYEGEGRWARAAALRVLPELEDDYAWGMAARALRWAFDARSRALIAASPQGGLSMATVALGAWLDGLPRVAWAAAAPAVAVAPAASPRIPARYLVSREDGVGKFWFASLEGASWTARWGQRGRAAQTKTYALDSAEKAAREFDKKVQEKLDKGYADAPDGARAAELAGRMAHPLRRAAGAVEGDFVHGAAAIEDHLWPRCRCCARPMKHLGSFHAHPTRLPLGGHAALALFHCDRGCPAWDPSSGANAALLLDRPVTPRADAPADVEVQPVEGVAYGAPVFEVDHAAEGLEDDRAPGGSKLGGTPTWVQAPEHPSCDVCKGKMHLAVQLDGGDTGMNFGDVGVGYAFVCADGHQAKLVAQSS